MTVDGDTLVAMTAFVESVRTGSFTAAARRMDRTPSAVSKLVARLERKLGTRLLFRTTRTMQPTEAGEVYYARAKAVLDAIDQLERDTASHDVEAQGLLRVTAPVVLGHVRVLPSVLAFERLHTRARVELRLTDEPVDLADERIDVAVRITTSPPTAYVARLLADDERVLCASPAYLAARGTPDTIEALEGHDALVLITRDEHVPWRLRTPGGQVVTRRFEARFASNHVLSLRSAALAGLGVADLPSHFVERDLEEGRLVRVLETTSTVHRKVYALYRPRPFVPARVRDFVALLARDFGRPVALD